MNEQQHPYITRLRLYDSLGTSNQNKPQSTSTTSQTQQLHQQQQQLLRWNITKLKQSKNYYRGEDTKNSQDYKLSKFNIEQSWNPVNNYVYGPTVNSIFNSPSEKETHRKLERILNTNAKGSERRIGGGGGGFDRERDLIEFEKDFLGKTASKGLRGGDKTLNRKLLGEFINNEAPKLCDHTINDYQTESTKMRYCTPLESYVSSGRDMVS